MVVEITDLDDSEAQDEPPEGRQFRFELGEGQAIPDIEAAIMTLAAGEEGEFPVTYPEDFADEAQRGQQQRLRIKLVEGRRKELPELDDEFAKGLGDFETTGCPARAGARRHGRTTRRRAPTRPCATPCCSRWWRPTPSTCRGAWWTATWTS